MDLKLFGLKGWLIADLTKDIVKSKKVELTIKTWTGIWGLCDDICYREKHTSADTNNPLMIAK
jgi:hypothetical protein